ncbi:hypothetical protein DL96DRAFT_1822410 [Flagelloscypha sp. PMI_526]|nr:hypothetical protein DL96DRAFT_1822410 [Flagelloscypha sp. PMI_526]
MVTTIRDIPPEILQQIFHCYVKNCFSDPDCWADMIYTSWHKALLPVCRNWHALACSTPELWSHVYTAWNVELLDLHFNRSSGAALNLYLDASPPIDILETITELTERIETFRIYVTEIDELEDMFYDWNIPLFPNLKDLQILLPVWYRNDDRNTGVEACIEAWIESSCPSLVNLEVRWNYPLDFCSFPETINSLHLASQTSIVNLRGWHERSSSITSLRWITLLQNLRTLQLKGEYIAEVEEGEGQLGPFDLPYLEILHLSEANIEAIERVLAAINCPPLLELKVSGMLSSEKIEAPEQLIETVLWMCQPIEDSRDSLVVASEPTSFSAQWVRRWPDGGPPNSIAIDLCFPRRSLSFAFSEYRDLLVRVWRAFTSETLSRAKVKIGGHCAFFPEDWLDTFGSASLKALEEINVEDVRRQSSILAALAETETSSMGDEHALFPSLKRLHLRRFHFESRRTLVVPKDASGQNHEPSVPLEDQPSHATGEQGPPPPAITTQATSLEIQRLVSTLIRRRSLGFGIEELTLDNCFGLSADEVSELRLLVKKLIVY